MPVASGMAKHDEVSAIHTKNRHTALYAAGLQARQSVQLPEAPFLHPFLPLGRLSSNAPASLIRANAVRFTATGGQHVTATEPAEVLVWEMLLSNGRAGHRLSACRSTVGDSRKRPESGERLSSLSVSEFGDGFDWA